MAAVALACSDSGSPDSSTTALKTVVDADHTVTLITYSDGEVDPSLYDVVVIDDSIDASGLETWFGPSFASGVVLLQPWDDFNVVHGFVDPGTGFGSRQSHNSVTVDAASPISSGSGALATSTVFGSLRDTSAGNYDNGDGVKWIERDANGFAVGLYYESGTELANGDTSLARRACLWIDALAQDSLTAQGKSVLRDLVTWAASDAAGTISRSVNDSVGITDSASDVETEDSLSRILTDAVGIVDGDEALELGAGPTADGVGIAETVSLARTVLVTDAVGVTDTAVSGDGTAVVIEVTVNDDIGVESTTEAEGPTDAESQLGEFIGVTDLVTYRHIRRDSRLTYILAPRYRSA